MADQGKYAVYKKCEQYLIYWIVGAYNTVVRSVPITTAKINTTGKVTLPLLIFMCELIAQHSSLIPREICESFEQVIALRKEVHEAYEKVFADNPDERLRLSNESHQHWIDGLIAAFTALAGSAKQTDEPNPKGKGKEPAKQKAPESIWEGIANRFSFLTVEESPASANVSDDEEQSKPIRAGSSKKGKKAKRGKGKNKEPQQELQEKDCSFVGDGSHDDAGFFVAAYCLSLEWTELRDYLQHTWQDAGSGALHVVVAGTASLMAISKVRKAEALIFTDFPERTSFAHFTQALTNGDPLTTSNNLKIRARAKTPTKPYPRDPEIDAEELYLMHTYNDLVVFIEDFQKSRTSKPTKRMRAEINKWKLDFNLRNASKADRLAWRRFYTIRWLYEVVAIYTSGYPEYISAANREKIASKIDWSVNELAEPQMLFGIKEFVAFITGLAMMNPGTEFKSKISPYHVFFLQCVVDSMTIYRGWSVFSLSPYGNYHELSCIEPYQPVVGFHLKQLREVDQLMLLVNAEPWWCQMPGFESVKMNITKFETVERLCRDVSRYISAYANISMLKETPAGKKERVFKPAAPSIFDNEGIWEEEELLRHSPFLCGVGLAEAFQLNYNIGMYLLDNSLEVYAMVHLSHMALSYNIITERPPLIEALITYFPYSFFPGGRPPAAAFGLIFNPPEALSSSDRIVVAQRERQKEARLTKKTEGDMVDPSLNRRFTTPCMLTVYRNADWNGDAIADEDLPLISFLAVFRSGLTAAEAKASNSPTLPSTHLIKGYREHRPDAEVIKQHGQFLEEHQEEVENMSKDLTFSDLFKDDNQTPGESGEASVVPKTILSSVAMLCLAKYDFQSEVSQTWVRPLCVLNLFKIVRQCMEAMMVIENDLAEGPNDHPHPWFKEHYKGSKSLFWKRHSFVTSMLSHPNDIDDYMDRVLGDYLNPKQWPKDEFFL